MALGEGVSSFLAERRLASFVITVAVILLMADAIRRVLPDETEANALTWIVLGLMAYAVVVTVVLPRRVVADVRLFVAWSVGVSPSLYGFAAALAGSPAVVMWLGALLSLCLVAWVAIVEAPRHQPPRRR